MKGEMLSKYFKRSSCLQLKEQDPHEALIALEFEEFVGKLKPFGSLVLHVS